MLTPQVAKQPVCEIVMSQSRGLKGHGQQQQQQLDIICLLEHPALWLKNECSVFLKRLSCQLWSFWLFTTYRSRLIGDLNGPQTKSRNWVATVARAHEPYESTAHG
jgi:hypothetical protein